MGNTLLPLKSTHGTELLAGSVCFNTYILGTALYQGLIVNMNVLLFFWKHIKHIDPFLN